MTPSFWRGCALGFLAFVPVVATAGANPASPASCFLYVGTYTNANSKGIYAWRMNTQTGELANLGLVGETANPSFLDVSPDHRFLYAVNETGHFEGKPTGSVTAFSIDSASGKLTFLNQQTSGGAGPCHLAVDHTGKNVMVANYDSGSIECLPIQSDGKLGAPSAFVQLSGAGPNKARQEGPHAHCIAFNPDNRFVYACDLGADKILTYRFDAAKGTLTPADPAFAAASAGTGPRHLIFSKDGSQAYVINELASTVTRYTVNPASGALMPMQSLNFFPASYTGGNNNTAAEIALDPTGRNLYASVRGEDLVLFWNVNPLDSGNLNFAGSVPSGGKTPRCFAIDPTGKSLFVANQKSDNIVIFAIDPSTGRPTPSGKVLNVPAPVCVKFVTSAAP